MKSKLKIIIGLMIGAVLFMIISIYIKNKEIKQRNENISSIPNFSFNQIINDTKFTNADLTVGIPTLIMYFNTECTNCRRETTLITQNIDLLGDCQIILISFEEVAILRKYYEEFNLKNYNNISVLQDNNLDFDSFFGKSLLPSIFIFNKDRYLTKKISGEVTIELLLKYIAQ